MPPDALNPMAAEFWARVGVAIFAGGIIGLERQIRGKVAGVRTSILICLGTELFVSLGSVAAADAPDTRVLGQVVTGIGFLGAGVILARGDRIMGVTTAAVIWALAALGATIGLGLLHTAIVLALVILAILVGVERLEAIARRSEHSPLRGSGMFRPGDQDS